MQIYKQDDLNEELANIQSPTNDDIINLISGKLSLFSIINDLTAPSQFKDDDIIHGFATQLKNSRLAFDKLHKHKFFLIHTQCQVCYNVTGFKSKNQDKVND